MPAFAHQASVVLSQPELESGTALTAKEMRPVNLAAETVDDKPFSAARGGLEPMAATTLTDGHVLRRYGPVLRRFRKALDTMYGHRLDRVVLFGSRARGDTRPDSDYDVAVFLRDMADRFAEMDRLADPGTDICDETGAFVHARPYRAVPTHAADAARTASPLPTTTASVPKYRSSAPQKRSQRVSVS